MITEPEIQEITSEPPNPGPDAPSKPGFLNLGPPRNAKIAKLSTELRELLNHMLAEGATGAVRWRAPPLEQRPPHLASPISIRMQDGSSALSYVSFSCSKLQNMG